MFGKFQIKIEFIKKEILKPINGINVLSVKKNKKDLFKLFKKKIEFLIAWQALFRKGNWFKSRTSD